MKLRGSVFVVLSILGAGCAERDLSGTWSGTETKSGGSSLVAYSPYVSQSGTSNVTASLTQKDGKISGNVIRTGGDSVTIGSSNATVSGTLDGDNLTMSISYPSAYGNGLTQQQMGANGQLMASDLNQPMVYSGTTVLNDEGRITLTAPGSNGTAASYNLTQQGK